jgi:hypothetical protein
MTGSWGENAASVPPAQARQMEDVCNRFEAAWQTGDPPRIEDFVEGWNGEARFTLQRELIALDTEYRRRNAPGGGATAALPPRLDDANDFHSQPAIPQKAIG